MRAFQLSVGRLQRSYRKVVVIALAVLAGLESKPAAAQYYYQPAPDYYHNDTASGTFVGGALGAVTGAIVGGRKDRGEGALIGAGVGALTGNLLGRSKDAQDERRAAAGAAAVGQMNQQAAAMAVTNYDLLQMTRAGVSEEVIISTMRSRGARIDLSPQSLIALKQQGVSDRVVMAAQDMSASRGYALPAPPTLGVVSEVPPPPPAVIVQPLYRPYYYYHAPHYGHYHHCHGPHTYVGVGF
ncbi:MAG: glycine zipper 2TM domain-containing protein [Pirellulales bacterium]|nr:glycine zipper 2TM domain-containing protein [Pirellulales bacterium]